MKKLLALVLAAMMLMATMATAMAAETMDSDGILGEKDKTLNKTLNIPVKLKAYNPDESSIYAPNIEYTFAMTAGSSGKTITDSDSIKANTKTAALPSYTRTIAWSSATTTIGASTSGDDATAANVQNLVIDFSNVSFGAAGVYRYTITETATYTGTGVTSGATGKTNDTTHTLYLDVYVKDSETAAGDTIYGYVLHTKDDDLNKGGNKVECFEDEYYTSNLEVTKTLKNDAAMNTHPFPFNVAFNASAITAGFHIITEAESATVSTLADKTYSDTAAKIANGGSIKYIGIPAGVTAEVYETNDVTGTTYKSEATSSQGNAAAEKQILWTETSNTATMSASTADTAATATVEIDFTNTLLLISPTGVVMRVAPYALILGAGLMLLLISRKRKVAIEEE